MNSFNNQFATQRLREEGSVTGTGATFTAGTGEQAGPIATKKIVRKKLKPEQKDVEPKLAAGKAKIYMKDKWGWKDAPSIPNRPSKGGFIYKQLFEELSSAISEGNVPENIVKFAKRKGATSIVNTIANWTEKAGKKITGGTAIGKNYDTLIIDLGYQDSAIYVDLDNDTIKVYCQPVKSYNDFVKALNSQDINEQRDSLEIYDRVTVVYGNEFYGETGTIADIHRGFVSVKMDRDSKEYSMHSSDVEKIEDDDDHGSDNPDDDYGPINESYSKFKTETKTRGKSDQFHQAVRQVRKKVQEINKLFEYVSRLKSELSEGEDGLKYKIHTEKALEKIKEMVAQLNQNIKKFK